MTEDPFQPQQRRGLRPRTIIPATALPEPPDADARPRLDPMKPLQPAKPVVPRAERNVRWNARPARPVRVREMPKRRLPGVFSSAMNVLKTSLAVAFTRSSQQIPFGGSTAEVLEERAQVFVNPSNT